MFCLPYSWYICSSWSSSFASAVALASAVAPFSVCDIFWHILLLTASILPTFQKKKITNTIQYMYTEYTTHVVTCTLALRWREICKAYLQNDLCSPDLVSSAKQRRIRTSTTRLLRISWKLEGYDLLWIFSCDYLVLAPRHSLHRCRSSVGHNSGGMPDHFSGRPCHGPGEFVCVCLALIQVSDVKAFARRSYMIWQY